MRKHIAWIFLIAVAALCYACSDDSSGPVIPVINSISPTMGPPGATVTISGSGFSATASDNRVTFNGVLASVSAATETSIEATVPDGAKSGAVTVVVNGQTAVGPNFTVEEAMPGITSVEPDSGTVGTAVTINGMNFSPTASENIVTFNGGVISVVDQASSTALETTVPEGAVSGPIQVEVDGQKTLSPSFTVIPETGSLEVIASTTGSDTDPDGYTARLNSGETLALDPAGTVIFRDLDAGSHTLRLEGIANNCAAGGQNPRTVTVEAGETTSTTFDIACERDQLVFQSDRTGNDEIFSIRSAGSDLENISKDLNQDATPRWSPDGTQILIVSDRSGSLDIWLMAPDGSNPTNLTDDAGFSDFQPQWSPDGTKIAFQSNRSGNSDVWVMDADGSNKANLTNDPGNDFGPVEWKPDGTEIAFVSDRSGNNDIWLMNADGSGQTNLTGDPGADSDPQWSPDGSQIAFRSDRTGNDEVWVMDADGSNTVNLTNDSGNDTDPQWSPDGTKIAFVSSRGGVTLDIWIMDADGSNPQNLTDRLNVFAFEPIWSPNGLRIAYTSDRTGDNEIWVMNADGSNQLQVTDYPTADDRTPRWRPN